MPQLTPRQLTRVRVRARLHAALERALGGDIARIFDNVAQQMAERIEQGLPPLDRIPPTMMEQLRRAIVMRGAMTARPFALDVLNDIMGQLKAQDNPADRAADKTRRFLEKHAAERVKDIDRATRKRIARVLEEGEREGLGVSEIARNIRESVGGDVGRRRALTIARTETHTAASYGSQIAAEETGLPMMKIWGATEDDRTRPDHADASGQEVELDEPFEVGGVEMQYPGDPSAPPEQTINCRCTVLYDVDREAAQEVRDPELLREPVPGDRYPKPEEVFEPPPSLQQPAPEPPPRPAQPQWTTEKEARDGFWEKHRIGVVNDADAKLGQQRFVEAVKILDGELSRMKETMPGLADTVQIHGGIYFKSGKTITSQAGSNALGLFNNYTRTMELAGSARGVARTALRPGEFTVGNSLQTVFRHEFGHASMEGFSRAVRQGQGFGLVNPESFSVREMFDRAKSTAAKKLSMYGATNYKEWFAESFAAYTHPAYGTTKLRLDPTLEALFDKVFKKVP